MRTFPLHPACPDLLRLAPTRFEALLRAEAELVEAENHAERDRFEALNREEEAQQDGRAVTRRGSVTGAAATVTALATAQFATTRASFGATRGGTLVHVFLYGGLDGLSLIAPADDPVLARARPDLLLAGDSLAIGRGFKLTSAFAPLEKYLGAGQLGFVPAVSDPRLSRSHFQAADACELGGLPAETGGRGWLDSLVDALGPGTAFRSVGVGSTLPRSPVGTNAALSLTGLGSLGLNGDGRFRAAATEKAVEGLFTDLDHPVEEAVSDGLAALGTAQKLAAQPYQPAEGVRYEGIGTSFRTLAQLIKGGANVRVATVGMGGYDTHENQGTGPGGYLYRQLGQLAAALAAFFDDLGPLATDVTVLVSSEFGRRVASNRGGTDHGHGGVVTILSGRRLAGSLLGAWNGLERLDSGDVPEYNNLFDVYGSVAQGRFGLTDAEVAKVFPRQRFSPMKLYA